MPSRNTEIFSVRLNDGYRERFIEMLDASKSTAKDAMQSFISLLDSGDLEIRNGRIVVASRLDTSELEAMAKKAKLTPQELLNKMVNSVRLR